MGSSKVEVVSSRGCSRLFVGFSSTLSSFRGFQQFQPMSPASPSVGSESVKPQSNGPFAGLVICVTGLSKEARKQVMEATERLGGQYSSNLHPQCTHLVVQISFSLGGRKFEHALKHGSGNGLFVVTLGWFVDSVRRNVRLSESFYGIKSLGDHGMHLDELHQLVGVSSAEAKSLPLGTRGQTQFDTFKERYLWSPRTKPNRSLDSILSGQSMYIDKDISPELRNKVFEAAAKEGASFVDQWFVGCKTSHVVCEGSSVQRYLGHSSNLVTPLWVLKTAKEKCMQRLVHTSADLARQINMMLEDFQNGIGIGVIYERSATEDGKNVKSKASCTERQQIITSAKIGVRNRRGRRMQTCQTPIHPISPSNLLDSICWSISEPTSSASIYTDSFSGEGVSEHDAVIFYAKGDGKESDASFANLTRPLTESEKSEIIFKNHFLTILFPVDRFSEMGPSSRTFFSENGFTCLQVLDLIYAFYQENMTFHETKAAIHTDSRHADRLRSVYSSKETAEQGYVTFKRIEFLGSRKSFEMLKRVSGDNSSNVYELLIRA